MAARVTRPLERLRLFRRASLLTITLAAFGITATAAAQVDEPTPASVGDEGSEVERPPRPQQVEPRADEILKEMSEALAATRRFALEAEETFDEVYELAPRVQLTNVRRMAVERPARLVSDASGDTLNRATWFDGHVVSALNKEENLYAREEIPGTIDAVLDRVADEYGIVVPLSDFVYSKPYEVLMEGVVYGEYLGIHQAAGVACHHLAFAQEEIEWQIWIDAGERPLPRKLVITYVDEPGHPQYTATIRRWSLEPELGEELFRFEPPAGAQRVDPPELLGLAAPGHSR